MASINVHTYNYNKGEQKRIEVKIREVDTSTKQLSLSVKTEDSADDVTFFMTREGLQDLVNQIVMAHDDIKGKGPKEFPNANV